MPKQKIAINASNLHVGGGVQVASSFISDILSSEEIYKKYLHTNDLTIFISDKVMDSIDQKLFQKATSIKIVRKNSYGLKSIISNTIIFNSFDKVFTVFGPLYLVFKNFYHICGFAQPWIAFSKSEFVLSQKKPSNFFTFFKIRVQEIFFFKFSNELVVETSAVKENLSENYSSKKINVVPNCLNSNFIDINMDRSFIKDNNRTIDICYVSRGYPHKNHNFIFKLAKVIKQKSSSKIFNFHITLSKEEIAFLNPINNINVINHGELNIKELASFYKKMDASIFPSKLECFSAFPIESMYFLNHLFVANEPFNNYLPEECVNFIDTENIDETANKILFHDYNDHSKLSKSKEFVDSLPSSIDRAKNYLSILMD